MSNSTFSSGYRRRTFGRAPSPPTWACYEQIPFEDDESDTGSENESCSEDDEDYGRQDHSSDCECDDRHAHPARRDSRPDESVHSDCTDEKMEVDGKVVEKTDEKIEHGMKKDVKGKQRAVEPAGEADDGHKRRERRRKHREPVFNFRPILTIQKSQGFVWNQDLFIPPYIKDRYVASTSPPNSTGFFCTSAASMNPANDYEVDVVEIRVEEGELADIIP